MAQYRQLLVDSIEINNYFYAFKKQIYLKFSRNFGSWLLYSLNQGFFFIYNYDVLKKKNS